MNDGVTGKIQALYGRELARRTWKNSWTELRSSVRWAIRFVLIAIFVVQLLFIHYFCKFVTLQQRVFDRSSRIEVEHQRRNNLVPRLAEIAKAYARHERNLMDYVSDARALKNSAAKMKGMFGPAKSVQVEKVVSKLIALAEQYPDLKAERSYQALMTKIVTTENRVAAAREEYVAAINQYNRTIQVLPDAVFARLMAFRRMEVYAPGEDPAPKKNSRFYFIY